MNWITATMIAVAILNTIALIAMIFAQRASDRAFTAMELASSASLLASRAVLSMASSRADRALSSNVSAARSFSASQALTADTRQLDVSEGTPYACCANLERTDSSRSASSVAMNCSCSVDNDIKFRNIMCTPNGVHSRNAIGHDRICTQAVVPTTASYKPSADSP